MRSIGIMTLSKTSETTYHTEMAKKASALNLLCYRFIPSSINPMTEKADGEQYNPENDRWESCQFDIPPILYDRCFYSDSVYSKHNASIVNWLKKREDLTFIGYGLPNKLSLYEQLRQTVLNPYLPITAAFTSPDAFIKSLHDSVPVVLKPANGSQGRGIYKVTKLKDHILIETDKQNQYMTKTFPASKAALWLEQLTENNAYFYQPYLTLVNQHQEPFDLRFLLQKDKRGKWHQAGNGIRTGRKNGLISNMSAGGLVSKTDDWLKTLPAKQSAFIIEELQYIIETIPVLLEKHFPPLFELGIDIGIDTNGAIWILDINSKPGRKVMLTLYPESSDDLYKAPLLYANYLADKNLQSKEDHHEKTISN
ncbi:YheC/YheD family protein [Cytobacillus gottheilii]|uniref:YheC/YheD family endospore coat-associated protein n=1 Tax=Cytobacillus gottheilii TaxID=859144 RepID=UPI000831E079|nr:YheC/YheD family protein [Cytobacillus gottheilii]